MLTSDEMYNLQNYVRHLNIATKALEYQNKSKEHQKILEMIIKTCSDFKDYAKELKTD